MGWDTMVSECTCIIFSKSGFFLQVSNVVHFLSVANPLQRDKPTIFICSLFFPSPRHLTLPTNQFLSCESFKRKTLYVTESLYKIHESFAIRCIFLTAVYLFILFYFLCTCVHLARSHAFRDN